MKNWTAFSGLNIARITAGCSTMCITPSTAIVDEIDQHDRAEHQPDLGRAARLDREQPDQDAIAIGMTKGAKPAWTVVRPSTADSTEIAGVIIAVAVEQARSRTRRA